MRNLKRVLSLALALVMMLSLMIVGAGAKEVTKKDFTDADEIAYTDAVNVMVALDVIAGTDTGAFNPKGVLTREAAAKIICYMLLGPSNAENLTTNTSIFTDVAAGRWSAGYISYCANLGILAGAGDGTFNPEGQLTGVAFGKMLLVALGYDPAIEGYVGKDWATAIASDLVNAGVAVNGVVLSEPLTREAAAQMAFQTLKADMVSYANKGTTVNTSDGTSVIVGASEAKAVAWTNAVEYDGKTDNTQQFCEKYFPKLELAGGEDDNYGRPGSNWEYKGEKIAFEAADPIATFTGNVKQADAYKALKNYKLNQSGGLTPKEDGANSATTGLKNITEAGSSIDLAKYIKDNSGNGVTITVYAENADDSKLITNVVVINTYVGQVTKVKTEKDETTVTVSKKAGGTKTDNTFKTEAFDKDDYVIYTVGEDGIETMTLAEKVTGKVTATSTDYLRLDGTKYDYAKYTANKDGAPAVKDEFDLYLAADGSVVYTAKVEGAADQYLYVKGADLYFDTISIRAVFADGTTKIVNLSGDTQFTGNAVVASGGTKLSDMTPADADKEGLLGRVYKYTEDGDTVKLTSAGYTVATEVSAVGSAPAAGAIKGMTSAAANDSTSGHLRFAIEKNNATLFTAESTNGSGTWSASATNNAPVVANNDTVYVMVSNGTTYTGFRNVPSMTSVNLTYVTNKDNAKLVDLVFISAKTDGADDNASYFYIKDKTKYEEQDGYTVWTEAYVNGEKTEIMTKGKHDEAGAGAVIDAAGVYKADKTNDKDQITSVTSVIDKSAITGVQADVASGGTLKLDAANIDKASITGVGAGLKDFSYNDETVFVSIDKDGGVTADTSVPSGIEKKASPVAGDSIYYVFVAERKGGEGKDQTTAKTVYVVEDVVPAPSSEVGFTFGIAVTGGKTYTATWDDTKAGTSADPKVATISGVSGIATNGGDGSGGAAITLTKTKTDSNATLTTVSGTEPTTTATGALAQTVLKYKVVAEDNTTECYYQVTITLTAGT